MNTISFIWGVIRESFFGSQNEIRCSADGRPGETIEDKRLVQHHGFSSRPPKGAGLVLFRSGNSWVVLGSDSGKGPALEEGEASLWYDDQNFIIMKKDGSIEIKSQKVKMEVDELNVSGKITADGDIESKSAVKDPLGDMAEMRTIFNGHIHTTTATIGATATPGVITPTATPMN